MTSLGRKKTESKRYSKQVLYSVKVNTNGKLETRTKGIVDKCSDLTCTKKYASTEGPKSGGGVNVGLLLAPPPSHFMLAYHTCCLLRSKLNVSYERLFRSYTCLSTAIGQLRKTESIIASYTVQLTVLVIIFLRNKSLKNLEVNINCNNRRIQMCQTRLHAEYI